MQEYEGVVIPPRIDPKSLNAEERQDLYCERVAHKLCTDENNKLSCKNCMFNYRNIHTFIEWEKEQKK